MTTERNIPVLYLVIPCYNEEAVLPETTKRLTEKMHTMIRTEQVDPERRILYVDDGSKELGRLSPNMLKRFPMWTA